MSGLIDASYHVGVLGLFSRLIKLYRTHFGLFWKVMIPVIIFSLLFDTVILFCFYKLFSSPSWAISISDGFTATTDFHRSFTFIFSTYSTLFLWFALSLLVLTSSRLFRGNNVSINDIWQQTYLKMRSIIGAGFILFMWSLVIAFTFLLLYWVLGLIFSYDSTLMITIFGIIIVLFYFFVRWSLVHQGIMIEDLTAVRAFRRSSELVRGRWFKFFGRFLLLAWISTVFTNILTAITLLLLSFAAPELLPIRDRLLSGEFFTLLVGIPISFTYNNFTFTLGNITMDLTFTPRFWITFTVLLVHTFTYAIMVPLWAILTTHLYYEQTGKVADNGENSANLITV